MNRRDCLLLLSGAAATANISTARAAGPVPLKFWTFLSLQGSDPRGRVVTDIVGRFNASQSAYRVEAQSIDYSRIDNSVIQATAAGQGPDIVNVYTDLLARHAAAQTLMPLDPYLTRLPEAEKSGFVVPLKFLTFGGNVLSLPWEARVWLLWYRKDLLAQTKLAVPGTLDAMGIAGGKLSTSRVMGFTYGASEAGLGAGIYETMIPLLWGAGGDLLDKDGKAAFAGPAGVKVVSYLRDLITRYHATLPSVVTLSTYDVMSSVKAGTTAMAILGSFLVSAARNSAATGQNLQTAPVPGWSAAAPSPARLAAQTLGIGASSRNPDGAWAFIQYYTSPESQLAFAKAGVMPSRRPTYADAFFSTTEQGREMTRWSRYVETSGRLEALPDDFPELTEDLVQAVQQVLLHGADPGHALAAAARQYNAQHKG